MLNAGTGHLIQKLDEHVQEGIFYWPIEFIAVGPSGLVLTMDYQRNVFLWEPVVGQKAERNEY